jgi:hypothetical protein
MSRFAHPKTGEIGAEAMKIIRLSGTAADGERTIERIWVKRLVHYNFSLEENSCLTRLNEPFLDMKVRDLTEMAPTNGRLYWLTFARLSELALYCAGNYADNLELSALGDLLVNPRLIRVHTRNPCRTYVKERHLPLTTQFRSASYNREGVIGWLKRETDLEIVEEPLLPYLYKQMIHSGYLSEHYLDSIYLRMGKLADTTGFLASWHVSDSCELRLRLQKATLPERAFVEENLCRFDKETFREIGRDLWKGVKDENFRSRFLREDSISQCNTVLSSMSGVSAYDLLSN